MMGKRWPLSRWVSVVAFILICSFFALVGVSEALAVTWFGKAGAYPFGSEGPSADTWYYASVEEYFWVMCISGVLWTLLIVATLIAALKRSDSVLLTCVGVAAALFLVEMINASIPQY